RKATKRFGADRKGSTITTFAVALPLLLGSVAVAVDYTYLAHQRERLQRIADAAAIAAAKEFSIANVTRAQIDAAARAYVKAAHKLSKVTEAPVEVIVDADLDDARVEVTLQQVWTPFMVDKISAGTNPIGVDATARMLGKGAVCVLGLFDDDAGAAIHIDNRARLEAKDCTVHSNATDEDGLRFDHSASMHAASICSAGGVAGETGHRVMPMPLFDCPKLEDPLVDRPKMTVGKCDHKGFVAKGGGTVTLKPGVYCGGLHVIGNTTARLSPGEYIISGGRLLVRNGSSLIGKDVGFYLTGGHSRLHFHRDTTIDLEAPRSGPLAGLLFYEDPDVTYNSEYHDTHGYRQPEGARFHYMTSNDARNLVGTFYLPKSTLFIAAKANVADKSAFTALVVGRLWLKDGPTLTINSDYALTEVPLPKALAGGIVALTE
ncbi:MAG: pilus assembly protein TadG-related protein, partial [Pseudomonadota bacterium]